MYLKTTIPILAILFAAGTAFAHDYDQSKSVTVNGVMKEISWDKPYVKIHLSVKNTQGKTQDWELETAAPAQVESYGLARTSLKKGDRITAEGAQAKNGSEHLLVKSMTLADGRTISMKAAQETTTVAQAEPAPAPVTAPAPPPAVDESPAPAPQASASATENSDATLPRTATNLPLIALAGFLALGSGAALSVLRKRSTVGS